jgi:hypothetical protein
MTRQWNAAQTAKFPHYRESSGEKEKPPAWASGLDE